MWQEKVGIARDPLSAAAIGGHHVQLALAVDDARPKDDRRFVRAEASSGRDRRIVAAPRVAEIPRFTGARKRDEEEAPLCLHAGTMRSRIRSWQAGRPWQTATGAITNRETRAHRR